MRFKNRRQAASCGFVCSKQIKCFFLLILLVYAELLPPRASNIQTGSRDTVMSYADLNSQKSSVRRTRLGPRWLVFAVGLGKENFWLDRRSPRDPSRKGEHIRKPYSVAKIISISPGAMPPFTLETHTINAKIKPSHPPEGCFLRVEALLAS